MIWNFSSENVNLFYVNLYVVKNVNIFNAYTYNIFKKCQETSLLHNIIQMMSMKVVWLSHYYILTIIQ